MEFTAEQKKAYARYQKAMENAGIGQYRLKTKKAWIPQSDYYCVEVTGLNHPMYAINEPYQEYKEAFSAWLKVAPEHTKTRMSMIRGDYDTQDSWEEKNAPITSIMAKFEKE